MKQVLLILLLSVLYSFKASTEELALRNLFYEASEDENASQQLFKKMKLVDVNSPAIKIGFKGLSYLIEAKHSYNPYTKLSFFNKGTELIEVAITKSPSNIELRFFRYIIQGNTPAFLGYKGNITEDVTFINEKLSSVRDIDLQTRIIQYFQDEKNKKWKKE
tara:strand:- start:2594 stop:3079 length:486 start_codon:yes stop_codon:yes gene_type:complete